MRLTAGEQALVDRVRYTIDAPNVLVPDDPETLDAPRWVIQRASPEARIVDLDDTIFWRSEILVRVETVEGDFGDTHTIILNRLLDRFPLNVKFSGVTIRDVPDPRGSFTEGGVYVTPVFIRGRFSQSP